MVKASTTSLTFGDHLNELRSRLIWSVLTLFIGTSIGFVIYKQLISFLLHPLHQTVYYSSPTGAVDFIIKVCLFFGFIVSLPVFVYNILKFIQPVFPKDVSFIFGKVLFASFVLMIFGMSFAYFVNLPVMLHFFNQFSSGQVHALISTDAYVSFILTDLIGFGVVFQMPLILLFFNTLQPISTKWLFKQEKFVIVIAFLIGAILTPDPINQTIMAAPIILLYQLSILLLFLQNRKKKNSTK